MTEPRRKLTYQPDEIAVLERYLFDAFPFKRLPELLPRRSRPSVVQRLNIMRRRAGALYRVRR